MTAPAESALAGTPFVKMSGSGNDFVFLDGRRVAVEMATEPLVVRRLCARQEGVGADGVVVLAPPSNAEDEGLAFEMIYLNADGTRAGMCGNAALCSTHLAVHWGLAPAEGMRFLTDSGIVSARMQGGLPEIDLAPVADVRPDAGFALEPGEARIGYALVGVPHLVVQCAAVADVAVDRRGRQLRHDASLPSGANVNFIGPGPDGAFAIRTFERGVEAETLACGTGATAAAILAAVWGIADRGRVELVTASGMTLAATPNPDGDKFRPALRGSARVVFTGTLE